MKAVGDLGERELIERMAQWLPATPAGLPYIGDDTAVIPGMVEGMDGLLTSDPVIEGVHFTADTKPEQIGWKAGGRALSDVAAMGGEAKWLLVNVVAPNELLVKRLEGVYKGLCAICEQHGVTPVGGDTSKGQVFALHIFLLGQVPAGKAVQRSGGKPGDPLYVTGSLGGSLRKKHLCFDPRLTVGRTLREGEWASSMIDLSDGLASDLRHLMNRSAVGAELLLDGIPVSEDARATDDDLSPTEHALYDGEDYELLFSVHADREEEFMRRVQGRLGTPCTRIGRFTDQPEALLCVDDTGASFALDKRGYEHFKSV